MSVVRVAVLDDSPIIRDGLHRVLSGFGLQVVAVDGVDPLVESPPDVLVLGPSLPARELLSRIRELRKKLPDSRVIVLQLVEGADFALPCIDAGAAGYLSRVSSCEELSNAIHTVVRDGRFLSRDTAELYARRLLLGERQLPPHSRLSPREFEVFLLLGAGHTVGEIATLLDISPKTVSTHRARIREKTGLSTNAQMVRYALERSMV